MTKKSTFNVKSAIGAFVLLALCVIGWQWYHRHFPAWNEEIKLSDGRLITVHRAQKLNSEYELLETALTIDLPELGGKKTWKEFLYPAIVDVYQSNVYVIGDVRGSFKQFGANMTPRYLYVAYVFSNGAWQRIPFLNVPSAIRQRENIPSCIGDSSRSTLESKLGGWCARDGTWKIGESSEISLEERAEIAKRMLRTIDGRPNASFASE